MRYLAAVAVFTTGNPMRRMQSLSDTEETIALPTPVTASSGKESL